MKPKRSSSTHKRFTWVHWQPSSYSLWPSSFWKLINCFNSSMIVEILLEKPMHVSEESFNCFFLFKFTTILYFTFSVNFKCISKSKSEWNHSIGIQMEWGCLFCHVEAYTRLPFCAMDNLCLFHLFHHRFGKCGLWTSISIVVNIEKLIFSSDRNEWICFFIWCRLKVAIPLAKSIWIFDRCRNTLCNAFICSTDWRICCSTSNWFICVFHGDEQMHQTKSVQYRSKFAC